LFGIHFLFLWLIVGLLLDVWWYCIILKLFFSFACATRNDCRLLFVCYVQVCKYFLDAVEKKQYGWFWECPNGGKNCHYRHALPPGYVLKSQMKALLEEEADKLSIEEEIENQVIFFSFLLEAMPLYLIRLSNNILHGIACQSENHDSYDS